MKRWLAARLRQVADWLEPLFRPLPRHQKAEGIYGVAPVPLTKECWNPDEDCLGHDWVVTVDGFQIGVFYELHDAERAAAAMNDERVTTGASNQTVKAGEPR